MSGLVILAISV